MAVLKGFFTMIVNGCTGSGKSQFVKRLLDNKELMISPTPKNILYCYGELNKDVLELKNKGVHVHQGYPKEEEIRPLTPGLLLIMDDLLMELDKNKKLTESIFSRGAHHWGMQIIFITQNLFHPTLYFLRLNSHYLILMKNPQGRYQINTLGWHIFKTKKKYFEEAYENATSKPFSYLLVDLHPETEDHMRLTTNIFPGELRIYYTQI